MEEKACVRARPIAILNCPEAWLPGNRSKTRQRSRTFLRHPGGARDAGLRRLCRLANDTNRPYSAILAARALPALGTNALPLFLAAVTNARHPPHPVALESISMIHADLGPAADQVVPAVVTGLNPTNTV